MLSCPVARKTATPTHGPEDDSEPGGFDPHSYITQKASRNIVLTTIRTTQDVTVHFQISLTSLFTLSYVGIMQLIGNYAINLSTLI